MPQAVGQVGWRTAKTATATPKVAKTTIKRYVGSPTVAKLAYLLIGIYAITFTSLSLAEHDSFGTNAFDLGNMDQAVWNTAQGRPFAFSNWEGGTTRLAAHVEPIILLLAQLYRVYSDPRVLLIVQSLVISLGALPAFWLAQEKLRNDFAALTFVAAYLLAPELEAANLADFHPVALSASFLLFAFYFAARRRYALFGVFAVLAMSTKEEIPLAVALMGLYIAFVQKDRRVGLIAAGAASLWFLAAFLVIIPLNNKSGASPYFSRYDYLGAGPRDIVMNLVNHPDRILPTLLMPQKVEYLRSLFMPVLFLSAFSPLTLLLAAPDLGLNLLSTFPAMYTGGSHYSSAIIPLVVVSGIYGLANLRWLADRVSPKLGTGLVYAAAVLVLVFAVQSYYVYFLRPLLDHFPTATAHHRLAEKMAAVIPREAGVSAGSALNPHVSQRERLALFPDTRNADYIFVDVTSTPYPIDDANLQYRLVGLLHEGSWGVVAAEDGYLVLKRGLRNEKIPDSFYSFAKAGKARPEHPLNVGFGDLTLVGYDVQPDGALHGADAYASATLYWKPERPVSEDFLFTVAIVGVDGHVLETSSYQPTTLWHPTSHWESGETVRVDLRRLPLIGRRVASVYLAVVDQRYANDAGKRLRPQWDGQRSLGLSADGTMLKLFTLTRG